MVGCAVMGLVVGSPVVGAELVGLTDGICVG